MLPSDDFFSAQWFNLNWFLIFFLLLVVRRKSNLLICCSREVAACMHPILSGVFSFIWQWYIGTQLVEEWRSGHNCKCNEAGSSKQRSASHKTGNANRVHKPGASKPSLGHMYEPHWWCLPNEATYVPLSCELLYYWLVQRVATGSLVLCRPQLPHCNWPPDSWGGRKKFQY